MANVNVGTSHPNLIVITVIGFSVVCRERGQISEIRKKYKVNASDF